MTVKKIGFWSVVSLVIGSQIGSGIFLMPASLAHFGGAGLLSWGFTATGAILLSIIFSKLCAQNPKTGGPHNYIHQAFGEFLAFLSAWTYWLISWVSSAAVIIAVVGYLTPVFNNVDPYVNLFLEILVLLAVTYINMRGVKVAGYAEVVFTVLKVVPLLIVPIAGLAYFNSDHFAPFNPTTMPIPQVINSAALLTMWGFIGLESATTPADSVENPQKNIPMAIICGTIMVAVIYVFSTIVIMGVVEPKTLVKSSAPYTDAALMIFGNGGWHVLVSLAASIVCLGTLNAWTLTSGQIALGAAQDGLFPQCFSKTNSEGAPIFSLLVSACCLIPLLWLTISHNVIHQVNQIIDISVTAFLIIYGLCTCVFLKFTFSQERHKILNLLLGFSGLIFCGWSLFAAGFWSVIYASLIFISGTPLYFIWCKKAKA